MYKTEPKIPLRIAIVDDHKMFRKGLILMLSGIRMPHSIVFEANHAVDMQIKIDTAALPDIIFLDVEMPGMPTTQILQWLQINHPEIKIILMGTNETEAEINQLLSHGTFDYIKKYIEPAGLRRVIMQIIRA